MTLESTIEAYLVKRVEALGGICLKGDVPGRRFIDRICIFPGGLTAYAELKRSKTAAKRKHQTATIEMLSALGHIAHFCVSKDEVDHFIKLCQAIIAVETSTYAS